MGVTVGIRALGFISPRVQPVSGYGVGLGFIDYRIRYDLSPSEDGYIGCIYYFYEIFFFSCRKFLLPVFTLRSRQMTYMSGR